MITREELRQLAQVQSEDGCAVSFYFQPQTPQDKSHREEAILIKDLVRDALRRVERNGGNAGLEEDLRKIMQMAEGLQVVDGDLVAGEVQDAVEQRGGMPVREHKAIAVDPLRVLRIVTHVIVEEKVGDRSVAQRSAGVTALGLLDCVNCEEAQCVDRCLLDVAHLRTRLSTLWCAVAGPSDAAGTAQAWLPSSAAVGRVLGAAGPRPPPNSTCSLASASVNGT